MFFAASTRAAVLTRAAPLLQDPSTFQPVCPASDGLYRFGGKLVLTVVGPENYKEYAPLIAGGLLRVRLELCVIESFVYEAVIPFVQEKGLSWILPLHETVETFLAGVIFAVASNFILIGSTKIVTVIATYADVLFGFPFRIVGAPPPRAHGPLRLAALVHPARRLAHRRPRLARSRGQCGAACAAGG